MAANVSQGSILKKGSTTIADITGISIAGITRAEMDTTALADTAKKFLMGTTDAGTIEIQFNYDDGLSAYIPITTENVSAAWSITVPCSGTQTQIVGFNAYQQSFSVEAAVDSQLTGSLTLRIDGAVSFGACLP